LKRQLNGLSQEDPVTYLISELYDNAPEEFAGSGATARATIVSICLEIGSTGTRVDSSKSSSESRCNDDAMMTETHYIKNKKAKLFEQQTRIFLEPNSSHRHTMAA